MCSGLRHARTPIPSFLVVFPLRHRFDLWFNVCLGVFPYVFPPGLCLLGCVDAPMRPCTHAPIRLCTWVCQQGGGAASEGRLQLRGTLKYSKTSLDELPAGSITLSEPGGWSLRLPRPRLPMQTSAPCSLPGGWRGAAVHEPIWSRTHTHLHTRPPTYPPFPMQTRWA